MNITVWLLIVLLPSLNMFRVMPQERIPEPVFEKQSIEGWNIDPLMTPNSTPETQQLYNFLRNNFGKYTISGQTIWQFQQLKSRAGKTPLVQGFDMQNYSPHNPWHNWSPYDDGTVQAAIDWYQKTNGKGIVTFFWHWFSPMGGKLSTSTFYTNYTDFNVRNAVTVGTSQYYTTMRDIDAIAKQLSILKKHNIPVIWRPLHEAGGKWFWWGSKTNVEALKLYSIMQERLIGHHGLNNLIWVWSTPESSWYPGNSKVDMIGYDSYPGSFNYDCEQSVFNNLRSMSNSNKMIQMTENGPIPDISICFQKGVTWGLFMSWNTLVFQQNSDQHIRHIYNNDTKVLTLQNRPSHTQLTKSKNKLNQV